MDVRFLKQHATANRLSGHLLNKGTVARALVSVLAPLCLALFLVTLDLRQDLSGTAPRPRATRNGVPVLGWKQLAISAPDAARESLERKPFDKTRVAVLGYMGELRQKVPESALVSTFTLTAEAGSFIHPPKLISDEMIEIKLVPGTQVSLAKRKLVWAVGFFRHLQRTVPAGEPLYQLENVTIENASENDVRIWLLP